MLRSVVHLGVLQQHKLGLAEIHERVVSNEVHFLMKET